MSNRVVTFGGAALAAAAGYYFYQAGGDPKVAQKKAEGMHTFNLMSREDCTDASRQPMPPSSPTKSDPPSQAQARK